MSSKDLIKITKELTGLKLQIVNNIAYDRLNGISTCIKICPRTNFIFYIMINLKEVRKLSKTYLFRRLGIKSIYLKTLLHEIAHIKQVRKFKGESFNMKTIDYLENEKAKIKRLLNEYLTYGGLPEIVLSKRELKFEISQSYYKTVLRRDLVERYKIKNEEVLKALLRLLIN